jgi:hypothetical protein
VRPYRPSFLQTAIVLIAAWWLLLLNHALAEEWDLGADVRYFQFLALEDLPGTRRDAELFALRLKVEAIFTDSLSFEAHGLLEARSPVLATGASIATGGTRRYFDLEGNILNSSDISATAEFDRLNLRLDRENYRLVVGRQAITWGVNYFWPALDLFAPFAPERIDRDYKAGVDAIRLTIPTGDFSEWDIVVAGQGSNIADDFSAAVLRRWNMANSDVGFMAASSHSDWVLGGFFVTELWGNGIRGEVAYTDSGDELDVEIGRADFWRASLGLDRQLSEKLTLVGEIAWSGYGATRPGDYLRILRADRVSRGEVNALGRPYAGVSLAWQAHPLLMVNGVGLANLDDGSILLQPTGTWSVSDNGTVLFGVIIGIGKGMTESGQLGSEYGATPTTVWGAFKYYF